MASFGYSIYLETALWNSYLHCTCTSINYDFCAVVYHPKCLRQLDRQKLVNIAQLYSEELESFPPLNLVKLHGHFILSSFHVLYIIQHFRHILIFHFLFFRCSLPKKTTTTTTSKLQPLLVNQYIIMTIHMDMFLRCEVPQ